MAPEREARRYLDYSGGPLWREDLGCYYVEVRGPGGLRVQRRSKNRRKLTRWWRANVDSIRSGEWKTEAGPDLTLGDLFDRFRAYSAAHHSSSTTYYEWAMKGWEELLGRGSRVRDLDFSRLSEIQLSLIGTERPASTNKRFAALRAILNFARERSLARSNPAAKIKRLAEDNEIVRYATHAEYQALLKAAASIRGWHWVILICLAVHTGLRRTDLLKLRWDECNFSVGYGVIRKPKTKNKSPHAVPLSATARAALEEASEFSGGFEYVFCHLAGAKKGQPFESIQKGWEAITERAGIVEPLRFHDLRHTFASWLVSSGVSLFTVQKLLGHHSMQSTMRYAHLAPEFAAEAVLVLDSIEKRGFTKISPSGAAADGSRMQAAAAVHALDAVENAAGAGR